VVLPRHPRTLHVSPVSHYRRTASTGAGQFLMARGSPIGAGQMPSDRASAASSIGRKISKSTTAASCSSRSPAAEVRHTAHRHRSSQADRPSTLPPLTEASESTQRSKRKVSRGVQSVGAGHSPNRQENVAPFPSRRANGDRHSCTTDVFRVVRRGQQDKQLLSNSHC
jgi:hypothetical protein